MSMAVPIEAATSPTKEAPSSATRSKKNSNSLSCDTKVRVRTVSSPAFHVAWSMPRGRSTVSPGPALPTVSPRSEGTSVGTR